MQVYDFRKRRALVTGGARGIGRAVAAALAQAGATVVVWDREPVACDGIEQRAVDITQRAEVEEAVALLPPRLDILVNDAGYLGQQQDFAGHTPEDWRLIIETNLVGTLQVTQALLPRLRGARDAAIVNLGSLAGKEGLPGLTAYSASSAGVIAFTKALAREVVLDGIRVNCVAPGPIDTGMIRRLGNAVVDAMIDASPLKRLGTVEEVAALVLWLCSPASSFSTGAVFDCSGGRAHY